jgi:hypothetical protein
MAETYITRTLAPLTALVCREYRCSVAELRGPSNAPTICEARAVLCWLARQLTTLSTTEIGAGVGRVRGDFRRVNAAIVEGSRVGIVALRLAEKYKEKNP